MQTIDHYNLRSFDLNLLLAFDALVSEASVTRAATRLRLKQPAMSHALGQLRLLFADQILVRIGGEMKATPRAEALIGPVRDILLAAQATLLTAPLFDPATTRRTFRLGLSDQLEALLLPPLLARFRVCAPGVVIRTVATSRTTVWAELADGRFDLAIGSFDQRTDGFLQRPLYVEDHVCCFHPALLSLSSPMARSEYDDAAHAMIARGEVPHGYLADALSALGVTPNAVVTTTNFYNLLLIASQAPVVVTVPSRLARRFAVGMGLTVSPLPFDLPSFRVDLSWHKRLDADLGQRWLRDELDASAHTMMKEA